MTSKQVEVHDSVGNIFADLGLPDADNHYLKAQIVAKLHRLTNERKLTQTKTGALMAYRNSKSPGCSKGISANTPLKV